MVISFGLYMAGIFTRTPVLAVFFLEMGYAFFLGAQTSRVTHAVDSPSHDLVLLAELLRRLEQETFRAPLLQQLHARLSLRSEQKASGRIAHLGRLERPSGLAAKTWCSRIFALAAAVDPASGHGHRTLATRFGPAHSRMDRYCRRIRSALFTGEL